MIEKAIKYQNSLFSELEKSQGKCKLINRNPVLLVVEGNPDNMTTVKAQLFDRESILTHGFDAYIPKPIDEKLFFKTLSETLYGK